MIAARWPRLGAAALGFVWFVQVRGASTLNPFNTGWLFTGDLPQHWLGFLFFQREPWSFPLGSMPSLLYPVGTNIGFTDSNPLLSILVKPFASAMPEEYQLVGLWLALCFALQGYAGAALTSTISKDAGHQLLGGYFFALSPVLLGRLGHDTLCAQWLVLGLLYLGLREYEDAAAARRAITLAAGSVVFAATVHPYLAAMTWVLALAVMVRLWRTRLAGAARVIMGAIGTTAALLGVWAIIGYFARTPDGSSGFGGYTADLLTFINPREYSRLLPKLPSTPGQWEGFGFLGPGGLLALAAGLVALTRRRPTWRAGMGIFLAACAGLGLYALSSSVRFAGNEVVNLGWLYEPLMPIVRPFRASGRFIWPLHYLVLAFGIWGVTRVFGRDRIHAGTVLLACVVAIQAADFDATRWWPPKKPRPQVSMATFEMVRGHYRHVALAPPRVLGACGGDPYDEDYAYRYMLLAYRLGTTFNSGIYARLDATKARAACAAQEAAIDAGTLDPQTIYVPSETGVERLKSAGAACGRWDGDWFCVSRAGNPRFAEFISTGKDPGASNAAGSR